MSIFFPSKISELIYYLRDFLENDFKFGNHLIVYRKTHLKNNRIGHDLLDPLIIPFS